MATIGKCYVLFPETDTVDCDGEFTLEDFYNTDLAKLWQETTNSGACKAKIEGQSFILFVPNELNPMMTLGGCRYFVMRCLNR